MNSFARVAPTERAGNEGEARLAELGRELGLNGQTTRQRGTRLRALRKEDRAQAEFEAWRATGRRIGTRRVIDNDGELVVDPE